MKFGSCVAALFRQGLHAAQAAGAGALVGFSCLAAAGAAMADIYPSQPIKLIVPYPAGGATDVAGRAIAAEMGKVLGQPVVVDNRSGGAGSLGIGVVAKSKPDGYTLGVSGVSPSVIMDLVGFPLTYDPTKDLSIVGLIGQIELVFVARKDFPGNNMGDLIKAAKEQPGKINYGSAGQSGNIHIYWEYLSDMAGIRMTHIPYRGDAPTLTDLMGGAVDVGLLSAPAALPQIKAGHIKALGVAGHLRLDDAASVPLVSQSGLPGYDVAVWNVLVGPAGMPKEIVEKLNAAMNKALSSQELRARFAGLGMSVSGGTPADAKAHVDGERERWKKVITKAGIKYQQ